MAGLVAREQVLLLEYRIPRYLVLQQSCPYYDGGCV